MLFAAQTARWARRLMGIDVTGIDVTGIDVTGKDVTAGNSYFRPLPFVPGDHEFCSPAWNLVDRNEDWIPKVLLVVAHPDDESECAALLYRVTHELGGVVDQVVVTNGEAGAQYVAPAQAYYGIPLAECRGRKHLVKIRRQEVVRAGRILGVRRNYFLGQKDTGFTFEVNAGYEAWDTGRVREDLCALMKREAYDLVVTLLPAPDTHGHHQTVALLTLEAALGLSPERRPGVLGVRTVAGESGGAREFSGLPGYPLTRPVNARPAWSFDRREPLGGHRILNYSIVVNWIIAEHKSQGMFQMEYSRRTLEDFWLFEVSGSGGVARWRKFLAAVRRCAARNAGGPGPNPSMPGARISDEGFSDAETDTDKEKDKQCTSY